MFDTPMAPTNAQPAAPAAAPQALYQIPPPGPSQALQPAAPAATQPTTAAPSLATYLNLAEPAALALDPVEQEAARILAEEERQSDILAFATPPGTIAGYAFEPPPRGVEQSIAQELAIRTLLKDSGVPAPVGAEANRLWNQALQAPPSEIDRTLQAKSAQLVLEQAWGPDFEKNLEAARREFRQMAARDPRIVDMVDQSGIGNSPYLIRALHNMARARGAK